MVKTEFKNGRHKTDKNTDIFKKITIKKENCKKRNIRKKEYI